LYEHQGSCGLCGIEERAIGIPRQGNEWNITRSRTPLDRGRQVASGNVGQLHAVHDDVRRVEPDRREAFIARSRRRDEESVEAHDFRVHLALVVRVDNQNVADRGFVHGAPKCKIADRTSMGRPKLRCRFRDDLLRAQRCERSESGRRDIDAVRNRAQVRTRFVYCLFMDRPSIRSVVHDG